MSKMFRPLMFSKNFFTQLDVFIQSETKQGLSKVLDTYQQSFKRKYETPPDKSHFLPFLGQINSGKKTKTLL